MLGVAPPFRSEDLFCFCVCLLVVVFFGGGVACLLVREVGNV